MMRPVVLFVVLCAAACVIPVRSSAPATNPTAERDAGCDYMVKFAEICYAGSDAETSCSDVYTAIGQMSDNADLRPSQRQALATFCGRTCMARKQGASWSTVERSTREQCGHSSTRADTRVPAQRPGQSAQVNEAARLTSPAPLYRGHFG